MTTPNNNYSLNAGLSSSSPFIVFFSSEDPTSFDVNFPIQKIWFNTTSENFFFLANYTSSGGVLQANWLPYKGSSTITEIDADIGTAIPLDGVIVISAGSTGLTTEASDNEVTITGIVNVPSGGTGVDTLTGIVVANSTFPFTGNPVTNHAVLVGGASNSITSVSPSATSGIPLISQGSTSNPTFGIATVPGGGTGVGTITGVLLGNGTSSVTGITPSANGVLISSNSDVPSWLPNGTPGFVLTANSSAPPSWQASSASGFSSINIQVFSTAGTFTYTPTTGMIYCQAYCTGSGAGGGSSSDTSSSTSSGGAGGGAGGTSIGVFSSATIGVSQSVIVGARGTGGTANNDNATNGNPSSFGALLSATGGIKAEFGMVAIAQVSEPGAGGVGSGGSINFSGGSGNSGFGTSQGAAATSMALGGSGGNSYYQGGGEANQCVNSNDSGNDGTSYGAGGSGGCSAGGGGTGVGVSGGNGVAGAVIIVEYIV